MALDIALQNDVERAVIGRAVNLTQCGAALEIDDTTFDVGMFVTIYIRFTRTLKARIVWRRSRALGVEFCDTLSIQEHKTLVNSFGRRDAASV